jgi:hypothetical protein
MGFFLRHHTGLLILSGAPLPIGGIFPFLVIAAAINGDVNASTPS